jgi:hypothetical protein
LCPDARGLDLAKHVFQVHGVDASGRVVVAKAIKRNKLLGSSLRCRLAWLGSRRAGRQSIAAAAKSGATQPGKRGARRRSLIVGSFELMAGEADRDPRHHTKKMQQRMQEIITHLREDVGKVDEPQLKAMFETAAEVLGGLSKTFSDYEQKNESAWKK